MAQERSLFSRLLRPAPSVNSSRSFRRDLPVTLWAVLLVAGGPAASAGANLLQNPGFEQAASPAGPAADWTGRADNADRASVVESGSHAGRRCLRLPAGSAIEQQIEKAPAGAYLARCWVKSEADQPVTVLLENPDRPWTAYSCTEIRVPKGRWFEVEAFCDADEDGPIKLTLGGMSDEFRKYHGTAGEMRAPILVDDCELTRVERTASAPRVWEAPASTGLSDGWEGKDSRTAVEEAGKPLSGTAFFQDGLIAGRVRKSDGGLALFSVEGAALKPRGVIQPKPALAEAEVSLERAGKRLGVRVSARSGASYVAWLDPNGVIGIEPNQVREFGWEGCTMRYGLLPSFVGTDLCYGAEDDAGLDQVHLPSTRWLVGLIEGGDAMLTVVWPSEAQAVSLGLGGPSGHRLFDRVSISTDHGGFSLSMAAAPKIWHEQPLQEDWLGEYVSIGWQPPFPARWMARFFVSPGGRPTFREPWMQYAFPFAETKTRMWGVWFEDWNHYPAFFQDGRAMLHFEKSFAPAGHALIYFLEPAGRAGLFSPCETVAQVLGEQKAGPFFDFDANALRRLNYSTPDAFMYDRPVCATTTHLSQIPQAEKATVGVNLATHLYEFIRGIRGRVDEYREFFTSLNQYFKAEGQWHPELNAYLSPLETLVTGAQAQSRRIYATSLESVQAKTDSMKVLLRQGKGDGFDCGSLDVRSPAGAQDDLCRRYNRLVLRLTQEAAAGAVDSAEKAAIAQHVWDQSRQILRRPSRWEPRRTLYFFEP